MQIMKRLKREAMEGIEVTNHENIKTFGTKEKCKYLSLFEADTIKKIEIKNKQEKTTSKEQKKFTRPNRSLIKWINTRAVFIVSYCFLFLKLIRLEHRLMVWFGLVSLFNGITTFVGYLMPKLFS